MRARTALKIRTIERRNRTPKSPKKPPRKKTGWGRSLPKEVMLKEMGPRDGLQNEKTHIPALTKLQLIRSLIQAGHRYIEVTAFVSPKAIPQLADAEEVVRQLPKEKDVTYCALVPNVKGMERALACGIKEVAVFTAASETFNQKNIRTSIKGSFKRFQEVFNMARLHGTQVRGYVSTAFVCPYEGKIRITKTMDVVQRLLDLGCYEVSIGDTLGKANPKMVKQLFEKLLPKASVKTLAGHFHDTYGMGVANVVAAMQMGIRTFDSSVGGLGGCPYAPGAAGNVATEDLVFALEEMGVRTGLSLEELLRTSLHMEHFLDHPIMSKVFQAEKNNL